MRKSVLNNALYAAALGVAALAGGAIAAVSPAHAATSDPVSITTQIMVEKTVTDAQGKVSTVLSDPGKTLITPGEKLLISLNVANNSGGPISGLKATNPMPEAVGFVSANESWAEFSVDGGKTFGPLGTLKVQSADATMRPATPDDVTDIRWAFNDAIPAGTVRTVSFHGVVK